MVPLVVLVVGVAVFVLLLFVVVGAAVLFVCLFLYIVVHFCVVLTLLLCCYVDLF